MNFKLISTERYESGELKTLKIHFGIYHLFAVIAAYQLIAHVGLIAALFIFGYVWMGYKVAKLVWHDYPDYRRDYFVVACAGICWPLASALMMIEPELRSKLAGEFANKYFYLRNPFVLKKMENENPNKGTCLAYADDLESEYVRKGRTRH